MHRRQLKALLSRYARHWPDEGEIAARFEQFVEAHEDCLLRSCVPGHITASAWILCADGSAALLTHHKKLDRWLQLGGHVDGEPCVERACLREAQEESGMQRFEFLPWAGDELVPLDLDVHAIPARTTADGRCEPRHDHWDVRFLLRSAGDQELLLSDESNQLRWFTPAELPTVTGEESVLRLARKAGALVP